MIPMTFKSAVLLSREGFNRSGAQLAAERIHQEEETQTAADTGRKQGADAAGEGRGFHPCGDVSDLVNDRGGEHRGAS